MPFNPAVTCDITIDVSHWQGNAIDWGKVWAAGKRAVMIKATNGTSTDSAWQTNVAGARQQGFLVIPYHFMTQSDATAQANAFIATAALQPGMAAAIDWEAAGAATAQQVDTVGTAVAAAIQRDPLGYWGQQPPGAPTPSMAAWPHWIPRYGVDNGYPDPTHPVTVPWLFWQYTSKATVDGIAGPVDASLFSGSEAELTAWCNTGALPASLNPAVG
jgi:lysozyme